MFMKNFFLFYILLSSSFTYAQWEHIGRPPVSDGQAGWPNIAINKQNEKYIAYADLGASYRCTVKKLVGNTWVYVGARGFSAGTIRTPVLAFDNNNVPYVTYETNAKLEIQKFNGSNWEVVISEPYDITIVVSALFDKNNNLCYARTGLSGVNNTLITTASGLHNLGTGDRPQLAFDNNNVLYAAFANQQDKAVVKKLNGAVWEFVGPSTGISAGTTNFVNIVIHNNVPYVTYLDFGISQRAIVKKFNGISWEDVGPATGISTGRADWPNIVIDSYGLPYVSFIDFDKGMGVTVMKYNGTIWDTIGIRGFTGQGVHCNIVLDNQNRAYLSFNRASPFRVEAYTIVASPPPVLPVRLLHFDARTESNSVKFNWSTASEFNNSFFTIERSQAGSPFTPIVQVNGAGTTNHISRYSAVDASPLPGQSSYRLKQTDIDGNFSYSDVRRVFISDGNKIRILPTVATGEFNVMIPKPDQFTKIEVYNEAGARIFASTGRNTVNKISLIAKGIYFVRVVNKDVIIGREKVVVQ